MSARITQRDLKSAVGNANFYLRNIQLILGRRYGYYAIDISNMRGGIKDTLIAGLTAREAYNILDSFSRILWYETGR